MSNHWRVAPRLAISVFNAEEVRAAIGGGAEMIDCEDPKAAIGMFEPRVVTDIAYAVRQAAMAAVPTSANVGVPQVVKQGAPASQAMLRSLPEIQAKAAQEALGLAAAMDVGDGRANTVKFSVDGLRAGDVEPFVGAVKSAIRNSRQFQNHRVVAACLELDRDAWTERRHEAPVIRELLCLGEFGFDPDGPIDLRAHDDLACVREIMARYPGQTQVSLVEPSEPQALGLPARLDERLKYWVETLAGAGADGILIDTPIQAKVANICLLATDAQDDGALPQVGTVTLDQLTKFAEYCAYRSVECWVAGSITPDHAERLARIPDLDVIMCRGAASEAIPNPYGGGAGTIRSDRRITARRVHELAVRVKGKGSR